MSAEVTVSFHHRRKLRKRLDYVGERERLSKAINPVVNWSGSILRGVNKGARPVRDYR